jgi:hypothetical protein
MLKAHCRECEDAECVRDDLERPDRSILGNKEVKELPGGER